MARAGGGCTARPYFCSFYNIWAAMIVAVLIKETVVPNQNDCVYLNPALSFEMSLKLLDQPSSQFGTGLSPLKDMLLFKEIALHRDGA